MLKKWGKNIVGIMILSVLKVIKMANGQDNLIPVRSKEEARERGRKGGQKSGEVRRKRKAMKEQLKLLLSLPLKDEDIKQLEERVKC